ncbi:hypothetical protein [Methanobacterium formicicum]|uniref:Uncharacterized protein n=1 Tax=Methanobacterium formicicum (strain DSM 3637 / PP1) TaxID=1204725 RepID=K2RD56_METFP|nr:hypothetical protein [Methanobacterium formicicum]EKF86269.1 hypothetical protein A994_04915 [Methanobacterium formicicum DSM 3637]
MNILTSQQKRVLNGIKYFSAEYQGGVPYNILKLDLDTSEDDLNPILEHLENENYISLQDGIITLEKNRGSKSNEKSDDVLEKTHLDESIEGTVENNPDLLDDVNDFNSSADVVDVGNIGSEVSDTPIEDMKDTPTENMNDIPTENMNGTPIEDRDDTEQTEEVEVIEKFSEAELESLEIIKKLVDDSGNISRTILEGNLLYGELGLSSIAMYNLITSLEYKGVLKKIKLIDGEYYKFSP